MDSVHRTKLRRNHVEIIERLFLNGVADSLIQEEILSFEDLEYIESEKTKVEKCQVFLQILKKRGPLAYKSFIQALKDSDQEDLAKKIDSNGNKESNQEAKTLSLEFTCSESITACPKCKGYIQKEARQPDFTRILKLHCCLVFNNVQPKYIIDHLYQEDILDEDEYERIRLSKTVRDRWIEMLQILTECKNKRLLSVFQESLLKNYKFIYEEIEGTIKKWQNSKFEKKDYRKVTSENNLQIFFENTEDSIDDLNVGHLTPFKQVCSKAYQQTFSGLDADTETSPKEMEICPNVTMHEHVFFKLSVTSCRPSNKVLISLFDKLAKHVNDGLSTEFKNQYLGLRQKHIRDLDILCVLEYLHAQKDLLCANITAASKHIDNGLKLVSRTSNPKYFELLIFNAKTRMCITAKKTDDFQTTLQEAKMMIESDKVGCTGLAAGWIFINEANFLSDKMAELDVLGVNYFEDYHNLRKKADQRLLLALQHFQNDNSMDKDFGTGFTICQYVILLMMCGKNGLTMGIHVPLEHEVILADRYLQRLENSDIPIPKSFQVHFRLAKCDYHFRQNRRKRALEYAKSAESLASKLEMDEYSEYATNRVTFLELTETVV